ncbi:MAG TPA: helix-turn-helix transcriptional regulator [Solirubrobacterales bacterium]|nr:helix-turn-helix transcriptional regulator [Solirubrobacterales bacterium]
MDFASIELQAFPEFAAGVPRRRDPQVGLARAIRKVRADADLNQAELARLVEVDPSQMSRLEKGKGNPSWGTMRRIAEALGVELADLAALAEDFEQRLPGEGSNGSGRTP